MTYLAQKDLEEELMDAANSLLLPPTPLEQLRLSLHKLEKCLAWVGQSQVKSFRTALHHAGKVLTAEGLLNHVDMDVRVSVASCINHILRITAPDAPFDDEHLKEIFNLTISVFEDISDTSSPLYPKRVSVLQSFAAVRSWALMLDLECPTMILQMFKHFIRNIRENHPDYVFTSMGLIMIMLLDDLDGGEITPELLSPLLDSVRKGNKDVLPIAQKLGERVIENCILKLKPYMMQAVQYMGFPLDSYSEIVTSICQNHSDAVKHSGIGVSSDNATHVSLTLHDDGHFDDNSTGPMVRVWDPEDHAGTKRKATNPVGNQDKTVNGDAKCRGKIIENTKKLEVDVNVNEEDITCGSLKGSAGTASRKCRGDAPKNSTRWRNNASHGIKRSTNTSKVGKTAPATRTSRRNTA